MDSTTICNLALARIGDQAITSLDDATPEGRLCKLFYQPTVDGILRMRDWRFATQLTTLSRITPNPSLAWTYSYSLPNNFSRIIAFNNFSDYSSLPPYEIQGDKILTDETEAQISYIQNSVDPSLFDGIFVEALTLKLASKLSKALAGSMDLGKALNEEFAAYMSASEPISEKDKGVRRKVLASAVNTSTSICNMALLKVGEEQINDIADSTPTARICSLIFNPTVSELLRMSEWHFAKGQASLTRTAVQPTLNWTYSYDLPNDFGRMVHLNQFDDFNSKPSFEIQGDKLLTNEDTASISYIRDTVAPALFSGEFVDILAHKLAIKLVVPMKADASLINYLTQSLQALLTLSAQKEESEKNARRASLGDGSVSKLSILNLALTRIGTETIFSLTDNSPASTVCNLVYTSTVNDLLRSYNWNWARKQVALTATTAPTFNWSFAYTLPADFARIVEFNQFDDYSSKPPYEVQGNLLLTDAATARISYIYTGVSEALFSGEFVSLLVSKLAAKLVAPMKADINMVKLFIEESAMLEQKIQAAEVTEQNMRRATLAGAVTSTTISNLALSKIGTESIVSITDGTPTANVCNLIYEPSVNELLRLHNWHFAKAQATLTSATAPSFHWTRAYTLPADFVRMVGFNKFDDFNSKPSYEIQGTQLLTNETTATIIYIKSGVAPASFSGDFVELLSLLLAKKLVLATKADPNIIKLLEAQYMGLSQRVAQMMESEENTYRIALDTGAVTKTSLSNIALSKVGTETIASITDNTPTANLCALFFEPTANEILRSHTWNWATGLSKLSYYSVTASVSVTTIAATGTLANHGFAVGQSITVSGASNANVNGAWLIATVPTANTFTFTLLASATGTYAAVSVVPFPTIDWDFQYVLPTDFLKMVTFNNFAASDAKTEYEIIGQYLYSDQSLAQIKYVKKGVDPSLYDSLFADLLTLKLAGKLVRPLKADPNMIPMFDMAYRRALAEARRIDAGDDYPRRKLDMTQSNFVNARFASTN